MELVERKQCVI